MITIQRNTDPKVATLQASWLGLSKRDARWLAANADIAITRAGQRLDTERFSYLPMDAAYAGTIIDDGSIDDTLACPTTVLIVPNSLVSELAARANPVRRAMQNSSRELLAA